MDDFKDLKEADLVAVEVIQKMFKAKGLGLREAMMATSVIFGRLRHQANDAGVNLGQADALFMTTARAITLSIEATSDEDQEVN